MSTTVEPGPLPKPLDKWIVLPGEAGTIQLTRTAGSRGTDAVGYLAAFALFFGLTVWAADRRLPLEGGGSMPGWSLALLFAPFTTSTFGAFLFHTIGWEAWRLDKNLLEVRRTLLGRSWERRYTDAILQISVRVQIAGQGAHEVWSLWLKTRGRRRARRLFSGSWGPGEVQALGQLLSECTGWPQEYPGGRIVPARDG